MQLLMGLPLVSAMGCVGLVDVAVARLESPVNAGFVDNTGTAVVRQHTEEQRIIRSEIVIEGYEPAAVDIYLMSLHKATMKTKKIIIQTIIVLSGIEGATVCYRHDISCQQICCIKNPDSKDNVNTLFYPYGFTLLHDSLSLQSYRTINESTLRIAENVGQWDFEKYSYLITYGNNVEQLSYSWLDTFIYDESPSYAKCWKEGKQLLIVDYPGFNYRQHSPFNDNEIKGNDSIYVYRLPHSPFLRGLQD